MFVVFIKAIFFFLLVRFISALSHCDKKLNVCLFTNGNTFVDTLEGARNSCEGSSSILLEIYDEEYQNVVDQAFRVWGIFNGNDLWLNLRKVGSGFRWLSTGREVTYMKWSPTSSTGGATNACISFSNNISSWQPYWSEDSDHAFICLQNSSQTLPPNGEKSTGNPSIGNPTTIHKNYTKESTLEESNGKDETRKKALIGALVVLSLLILLVAVLLSIWCFIKRRKRLPTENTNVQIPPPSSLSTPDSQDSIYYISEGRKETLSAKRKKLSNLYTQTDNTLSHIIRYHKPPDLGGDSSVYESIRTLDFRPIDNPGANNQIDDYYSNNIYAEEFTV